MAAPRNRSFLASDPGEVEPRLLAGPGRLTSDGSDTYSFGPSCNGFNE